MMPPKCCSHLRFKLANRPDSVAMCSSPLCLQASPLSATGHLRILLNDGPFSKQPSHCMHCRQKWALESSCIVAWCDYSTIWPHVVAWRSYVRLVGDKVHDQELVLTCLKLDVVQAASNFLPFFFWAMMSCMITSLHHRTYVHVRHMVKHLR